MVPVIDGWMLHTHPVVSENGKHRCIARMRNSSKMPGSASPHLEWLRRRSGQAA